MKVSKKDLAKWRKEAPIGSHRERLLDHIDQLDMKLLRAQSSNAIKALSVPVSIMRENDELKKRLAEAEKLLTNDGLRYVKGLEKKLAEADTHESGFDKDYMIHHLGQGLEKATVKLDEKDRVIARLCEGLAIARPYVDDACCSKNEHRRFEEIRISDGKESNDG